MNNEEIEKNIKEIKRNIHIIEKVYEYHQDDLDSECLEFLEKSINLMNKINDRILINQKKRGKSFISTKSINDLLESKT